MGLLARGQAVVEFAIISGVALIVLLVGIQFALIGQCALAVTQLSYTAARYASVHPTQTLSDTTLQTYIQNAASPTLLNNGIDFGGTGKGDLSIFIPSTGKACPSTNSFGAPVTIEVQYDLSSKIFLPNPFLGIPFPTTVQSIQTAFCEG